MRVPAREEAKIRRYSRELTSKVALGYPAVDGDFIIFDDHRLAEMDQLVSNELVQMLDPEEDQQLIRDNVKQAKTIVADALLE